MEYLAWVAPRESSADEAQFFFFFNDTATTEIYTLSLHDALPISWKPSVWAKSLRCASTPTKCADRRGAQPVRSEEHTSELQSRLHLVCRLLLEKKTAAPSRDTTG